MSLAHPPKELPKYQCEVPTPPCWNLTLIPELRRNKKTTSEQLPVPHPSTPQPHLLNPSKGLKSPGPTKVEVGRDLKGTLRFHLINSPSQGPSSSPGSSWSAGRGKRVETTLPRRGHLAKRTTNMSRGQVS